MDILEIDYLGLDRVLRRGSGKIIAEQNNALLVRDCISGACLLACENAETGMLLLDGTIGRGCDLLMVSDRTLGNAAFEKFGFSEKMECFQVAYYGEKPLAEAGLTVRTAHMQDLPVLIENYQLISPEELEKVVKRENILLGYSHDRLVGFVGEHLEGSMGILYVFPECRRKGFGTALQKYLIARTMEKGFIPFGQVEKGNHASLAMQEKIGMTISENLIVWMWK